MNHRTHPGHRILAILLTVVLAVSLLPLSVLAGQEDGYHDPAEHWMNAGNRTNELDANAVVTHETYYCYACIPRAVVIFTSRTLVSKVRLVLTFETQQVSSDAALAVR